MWTSTLEPKLVWGFVSILALTLDRSSGVAWPASHGLDPGRSSPVPVERPAAPGSDSRALRQFLAQLDELRSRDILDLDQVGRLWWGWPLTRSISAR